VYGFCGFTKILNGSSISITQERKRKPPCFPTQASPSGSLSKKKGGEMAKI